VKTLSRARGTVALTAILTLPLAAATAAHASPAGAKHPGHKAGHHAAHKAGHKAGAKAAERRRHHKHRHAHRHHKKAHPKKVRSAATRADVLAGVPAGTTLKPSGSLTITTPGATVNGLDIKGTLTIKANNVTVRNTRVTSGTAYNVVTVADGATGVTLDHVTINGTGLNGTAGANGTYGPGTYNAVEVTGVENGFVPSSGATITNSWVHHLASPGSPHYDGVQIDGARSNITLTNSTIDLSDQTQTSAVMVDNYFGAATNIVVSGNRLLGAGYTVYADGQFNNSPLTVTYANNRIGQGRWGYSLRRGATVTWSGNTDDKTGQPIS